MSVWVVVQSVCMHVNKCFCLKCSTTVIDVTILVEGKKNKVGCLRNCGKRFMFYVGIQQVARKNTFTCRAIFGGNSIHNTNTATWVHQFSSVTQSCPTLGDPMDCSTPGLPVHHQLPEFTQTHVHWVGDAIQPFHPLQLSPSPPAFSLSQHQGLFKWVSSLHQVAKVLEFQLQYQSLQWTPRTDLL